MGYAPRECPDCGASLDPGEICDCKKGGEAAVAAGAPGDKATEDDAAAIQAAIAAACKITLEKTPGSMTFARNIEASSTSAALNGVAVLIRELAVMLGAPVTSVLSMLTVALIAPTIQVGRTEGVEA